MLSRFNRIDLMLVALASLWGVNYNVVKSAISGPGAVFTPIAFNAIRFSLAAITSLAIMRQAGYVRPESRRHWLIILGLGILGNTVYQVLFIVGIGLTSAAGSAMILATTPVLIALIGGVFRIERLSALAWAGITLSFAGIVVVVLGNEAGAGPDSTGNSTRLGDLLIFLATTTWSIYTLLSVPMLRHYSSTTVTSLSLAAGALPLVVIALPDLARLDWRSVPLTGWTAALFSGMFALGIGYVVWNHGIKLIGGARTAVYSNLIPVVAAIVAWLARREALTVYHLLGAAIILTGINLTRRGRQARLEPLPAEE